MDFQDWFRSGGRRRDPRIPRRDLVQRWGSGKLPIPLCNEFVIDSGMPASELDYEQASLHLLVCPTQDAARTLANVLFDWHKLDPDSPPESSVGRYAARGVLSYLEASFILAARTFLSHFMALALAAYPALRVVAFPYPPPQSALAKSSTASASPSADELTVTKLASLNFLQLAIQAVQAGVGESVDRVKVGNEMRVQRGAGTKAWQSLVSRYEKQVQWLRIPEVKEVSPFGGVLSDGQSSTETARPDPEPLRDRPPRRLARSILASVRQGKATRSWT